jgi:hypothetical protein
VKTSRRSKFVACRLEWPLMSDLVFVLLTIAFFALTALIVKGVERL